jgi:uncharacterized membrane protein
MDDREAHRRRLAELAAEDRRKRAAAEPEIARREAALAEARARLRRLNDENDELEAELDGAKPAPANDDEPPTTGP